MYDEFELNNTYGDSTINDIEKTEANIDSLFNNLTEDIANVNKFISIG